jgi:hypothetical protein
METALDAVVQFIQVALLIVLIAQNMGLRARVISIEEKLGIK